MSWRLAGRLVPEGDDAQAPLSEYRVEAVFRRAGVSSAGRSRGRANVWERLRAVAVDGPGTSPGSAPALAAPESSSTVTGDDGGFTLTLPDRSDLAGPVELVASAPSGVRVAGVSVALDAPDAAVEMPVEPLRSMAASGPAVAPPRTYHVNGRVFDRDGRCLPDCMQIVLYTRRSAAADAPLVPLLAQHLDASGYFFGDLPDVALESLTALVSVFRDPVPLRLVNGRAIAKLVVVGELDQERVDAAAGHDCACGGERSLPRAPSQTDLVDASDAYTTDLGGGRCIDFTVPNRAIDEFDFYSVVRTTEPEIRGITLEDPEWQTTRPAGEAHADDDGPGDAPAVLARSWEVVLLTGARGTWGVVRVFVTTDDGRRLLVLSKRSANDVGGLLPNEGNPAVAEVVLQPNSSRTFPVTTSAATGLDLATVTGVEVEWVESNTGDAWGFQGIGMVALTSRGRVPLLINDATLFRTDPEIRLFDNSGGTPLVWSAPAAVGSVPAPAGGPPPPPAPAAAPAGPGMAVRPAGRTRLAPETAVDWDSSPTFYEAASVAHGHLLHYKQVWHADGYSLGDLVYSLPLAPGQKKLISVVDWERSERTSRTEDTVADEMVAADLARDRDLREVVTGALTESSRGGSKNTTTGVGVGTGAAGNGSYEAFNFGALLGVSGGYGGSDSTAWQVSARDLSTSSLQTLRDRTLQSASAVRGLRSSVVQTVSQGESTRVTTEVVANHNHCHAMTVQYFEVLRHLRVTHELADVQECLFVPLPMFPFDRPKSLRWRDALTPYLSRPELGPGFDAARRVQTNWSEVDYPAARYSDEMMLSLGGEMDLTVMIPLPPMPVRPPPDPEDPVDTAKAVTEALNPTTGFLGVLTAIATGGASLIAAATTSAVTDATKAVMTGARGLAEDLYAQESPEERYARFHHDVMPGVAAGFVDQLQLWGMIRGALVRIASADFTLVSEYRPGTPLLVTVRADLPAGTRRRDLQQLVVRSTSGLPSGCRAIVNTASFRYRTRLFEHALLDDRRANDDIDLPGVQVDFDATTLLPRVTTTSQGAGASLSTPTDAWEARNPRDEDRRLSAELLDHLNDNIDFYHHAMWWTMDPNRRFMLLDGHVAPGSGNRSIASVVENRLIGIIGNSLVLPVAQGVTLDPRFAAGGASLREAYELDPPVPPARVSLPTRGVFAEAVMGNCNACEEVDDSRFWRWEESPIDEPPAIEAASTASRRAEPPAVTPTEFPPPIVSIQNAPAIPDPAGVGAALDAITRQSFSDITGLAGTQANAAAAYAKAMDNALAFGKEASALAQAAGMQKGGIQKSMGAIDKAESEGKIESADARRLRVAALEKMIGGTPADDDTLSREGIEGLTDKAGENDASVKVERPGSSLEIDARQPEGGGGDEVASSAELPEGLKPRKGLLPAKGVTPAKKVATVLSLFGDAPIATAADVNQIFGAIGKAGVSSYLSWLRSRAALLGMDRRTGFQSWQRGDAAGGGVKQFNFKWGPTAETGFEAFWDGIATMYAPHTTINIVEFLALDLATHVEGYGDYAIVSEAERERFGLDYFFEANWKAPNGKVVGKRSYNTAPNRLAGALFADADFAAAHDALLPAGPREWSRGDVAWSGTDYFATDAPKDVASPDTEFIRQADFYKFRGRGWIQTTNRDNYRDLAKALREEIDSIPDPMWSSVATWAAVGASDAAFDKNLTQSRDSEWNDLFRNTGGVVAWLGVRTFSRMHGDCLYIAPPAAASLNGNAQGSVGFLGDRINGYGGALREAVRRVLIQMYDSLT